MKLVSFNIRCDFGQDGDNNFCFRRPFILDKIAKEKPDIICFQEVLPHVADWLKVNLTDYYLVGCGRDENLGDEQTSIAYRKRRFNLAGLEVFWLSETPQVPGSRYSNQSECPRICTAALFQNLDTKGMLRVYNTHLDHIGSGARMLGLGQILGKMAKENDNIPVIIAGDFNAFPDSPEMELLKQYPQIFDMTAGTGGTFHDYGQLEEEEKIDYILASGSFRRASVELWKDCHEDIYLSDHYPVCVEMYTV